MKPGPLLADARRRAGLTQADLAARLGLTQSAVAKLERYDANPTARTLERAVRATGYQIDARLVPAVDETLIRAQLALPPAERIRRLERQAAAVDRMVDAGARARGERA